MFDVRLKVFELLAKAATDTEFCETFRIVGVASCVTVMFWDATFVADIVTTADRVVIAVFVAAVNIKVELLDPVGLLIVNQD